MTHKYLYKMIEQNLETGKAKLFSILPYTEDKCTAIIYILCTYLFSVGVFCLHVCLGTRHMPYLGRPEKCIIIDGCELPRGAQNWAWVL